MPKRKPARKRSLGGKVTHACAQCGAAMAAGVLFCTGCVVEATPAHAKPSVVKLVSAGQVSHVYPFADPAALAGLLAVRPEDSHLPEPTYTVPAPGIFAAGTAVTGQPAPRGRAGGGWPWTQLT